MTTTTHNASTTDVDEQLVEAFADRFFSAVLGAQDIQAAYLGDRLGWYRALDEHGPLTAIELAAATGTAKRYAQEWLEHQAVAGWLTVDDVDAAPLRRRYALPAAHAAVLTRPDELTHLGPLARFVAGTGKHLDRLAEAYRTGGGVSWAELGPDPRVAQAAMNRPLFMQLLAREYLAGLPDVDAALRHGGRVADIGCGHGWSSLAVALEYPTATVDGFDPDVPSVEEARRIAADHGVGDRVHFHAVDAASLSDPGAYDVVLAFECIHDLPDPVSVLRSMRQMVAPEGTVIVMDERAAETFTAPGEPLERLLYGFSLTCCLPDGMSEQPSVATGTVIRPATLEQYALAAGFTRLEVLPIDNESFRFYRLHV